MFQTTNRKANVESQPCLASGSRLQPSIGHDIQANAKNIVNPPGNGQQIRGDYNTYKTMISIPD
jgi:hypothetical protein